MVPALLFQRSDLDVPLPDGMGDAEYLATVAEHLPRVLTDFRPNLVLYDAGVDPHQEDSLGRSDRGLILVWAQLTRRLVIRLDNI
jgi:acetoin utilization deacetylase AcuC-like enzyme